MVHWNGQQITARLRFSRHIFSLSEPITACKEVKLGATVRRLILMLGSNVMSSTQSDTPPVLPSGPPPVPRVWYASIEGVQEGPFSADQILGLAASGRITPATLVWKEGNPEWQPLALVPEMQAVFSKGGAGPSGQAAVDVGKKSALAAFQAFKTFAVNPLGGLEAAYRSVGKTTALSAAIVFAVVYVCLVVLALRNNVTAQFEFGVWVKIVIAAAVPFVSIAVVLAGARKFAHSEESFHADVFVAASMSLVFGIFLMASRMVGFSNAEFILVLFVFALCYFQFILFSALTRIYGVREALATVGVPVIIVASLWLSWFVLKAMLERQLGGALPVFPGTFGGVL